MCSARDTPETAATTAADSHTPLPDRVHEHIQWEVEAAYHAGWHAALEAVAAGHAELDATWQPIGRRGHEQRVRERLEHMETKAVTAWRGLDNGAVLPSADWGDDKKTAPTAPAAPGPHIRRAA